MTRCTVSIRITHKSIVMDDYAWIICFNLVCRLVSARDEGSASVQGGDLRYRTDRHTTCDEGVFYMPDLSPGFMSWYGMEVHRPDTGCMQCIIIAWLLVLRHQPSVSCPYWSRTMYQQSTAFSQLLLVIRNIILAWGHLSSRTIHDRYTHHAIFIVKDRSTSLRQHESLLTRLDRV